MKKIISIITIFATILSLFAMSSCGECKHENLLDATCTSPAVCSKCGAEIGFKLDHNLVEATCTEPEHCSRCGVTIGSAFHRYDKSKIVKEPTCIEEGLKETVCSVCGDEISETIPRKDHEYGEPTIINEPTCTEFGELEYTCSVCGNVFTETSVLADHVPSDPEIVKEATIDSEGVKRIVCSVCGEVISEEEYSLSEEEFMSAYKSECASVDYKEIARDPDSMKGKLVKVTGRVFQVIEADSSDYYCIYMVNITKDKWGYYDDTVEIRYDGYGKTPRILEDDIVTFWGEYNGLIQYETVMGATNTVPMMTAEYIEIK